MRSRRRRRGPYRPRRTLTRRAQTACTGLQGHITLGWRAIMQGLSALCNQNVLKPPDTRAVVGAAAGSLVSTAASVCRSAWNASKLSHLDKLGPCSRQRPRVFRRGPHRRLRRIRGELFRHLRPPCGAAAAFLAASLRSPAYSGHAHAVGCAVPQAGRQRRGKTCCADRFPPPGFWRQARPFFLAGRSWGGLRN